MAHHAQFSRQIDYFSAHPLVRRVVAYDAFGCGRSDKPHGLYREYGEHELLRDLRALYRRFADSEGPNILVGHSFGTNLVMRLAAEEEAWAREHAEDAGAAHNHNHSHSHGHGHATHSHSHSHAHPPPVAGLVLIGTSPRHPGNSTWIFHLPEFVLDMLRAPLGNGFLSRAFHPETPKSVLEEATRHNRSNPWHVTRPFYQQVEWHASKSLHRLRVPTAVIVGEGDKLTTPEASKEVAEAIPEATFHVIPKASHMVMLEKHEEVNAVIEGLIKSVLGGSAASQNVGVSARAGTGTGVGAPQARL
jgi:pimeloyl-ACP methyl ester carboxylesterase